MCYKIIADISLLQSFFCLSEPNGQKLLTLGDHRRFHTAGKGTRLAPLPGSENNNKPGVKLPVTVAEGQPVSILESVIQQTGIYAASRKGRLSVFWGDQVRAIVKKMNLVLYLPGPLLQLLGAVRTEALETNSCTLRLGLHSVRGPGVHPIAPHRYFVHIGPDAVGRSVAGERAGQVRAHRGRHLGRIRPSRKGYHSWRRHFEHYT